MVHFWHSLGVGGLGRPTPGPVGSWPDASTASLRFSTGMSPCNLFEWLHLGA